MNDSILGLLAVVGGVGTLVLVTGLFLFIRRQTRRARVRRAKTLLHRRREWLEAEFLSRGSQNGKSRSVVWEDCEFEDHVAFARDRTSGQLRALVAVTITLASATHDPEADDVENDTTERAATAVFGFDGTTWTTDGRAIFNLNPAETIRRYGHELELVD